MSPVIHRTTRLLAAVFLAFGSSPGQAQVATSYNFAQAAGTYAEITGGTTLWGGFFGSFDNQVSSAQTIPAFNFDGTVYTQMYVSANGFITFGSAPTGTNFTPLSSGEGYAGAIAAFGADIENRSSGLNTRDVRWQTVGNEVVVQWRNATRQGVSSENFNAQVRLNTSTNEIRVVYGSLGSHGTSTVQQPEVGLRGPNNTFATNVNNRTVGTGAENWASSLPGTSASSKLRFTATAPAKAFTNGLTYTWAPSCTQPTATVSNAVNCPGSTYTTTVNVTDLGSAADVTLISSVSGTFASNVGIGSYAAPAIALGTTQSITVVHNTSAMCNLTIGGVVATGSCVTNGTCLSPTPSIPDNGCGASNRLNALIPITTAGTALGTDVFLRSVDLIVAHGANSEVQVRLVSPTGQIRNLVLNRFGSGSNMGNPSSCPGSVLHLTDTGTPLTSSNSSNVTGSWAPEQSLAGFTGDPNGQWSLQLCDNSAAFLGFFTGTLNYANLNFGPCIAPVATVVANPNYTTGTYTATVTVTSTGSGATVDIESGLLGLEHDNVGVGTYTVGPYPICSPTALTLKHASNATCDVTLNLATPWTCVTPDACLTPALAVPDNGCGSGNQLVALFNVTAPGNTLNTDVLLDHVELIVSQSYNADLEITLTSPTGQTRNLILDRFGSGDNLGNPSTCPATVLRLKDGGTALSNTNTSNVTGTRAPEQSLAGFTGNPNGYWRLTICDDANGDVGTLKYVKLGFLAMGSIDPCAPRAIGCFESINVNSTAGAPTTLPAGACTFNGAASTGGVHWWAYTATSNDDVRFSVCNPGFNVRLSAFKATGLPACSNLQCVGGVDDSQGCGNGGELKVKASIGDVIYLAVHGTANGTYTLTTDCTPACAVPATNDLCSSATIVNLAGFNPVTYLHDLTCAYVDAPTSTSGTSPVQGLWYTFNSGPNSLIRMYLGTPGTALGVRYVLYSGLCSGLGAASEVANGIATSSHINLAVTPGADYRLLVYNSGGNGVEGNYTLSLEAPPLSDAAITAVIAPGGLVCGTQFQPVVTLKNLGEYTLTSVPIQVSIDGGAPLYTHTWTGSLPYLAEVNVTLPLVNTPTGNHTLNVKAVLAGDERTSNDQSNGSYNADGQLVRVRVTTDNNPGDITWVIYDASLMSPIESSLPYFLANTTTTTEHCLPASSVYYFTLSDNGGDGINSGNAGSWQLLDGLNRSVLRDDGYFTSITPKNPPASAGYASHEFRLPLGPAKPWTNSPYTVCGNFAMGVQSKVRCNTVGGVSSYQWEFSNPNQGYRRRVTANTNFVTWTSMGTTPPVLGVTYFVRNRADQGASGFADDNWGEGCEMAWAATSPNFCTNLVTTPGSTLSCNVSRTWGGNSKLWAQPVVGAVPFDANADGDFNDAGDQPYAYHFRFTSGAFVKDVWNTTYIQPLNWLNNPLVPGTYTVQVEAQVGGVWRGFCSATTCTVTITGAPAQGGGRIDEPTASTERLQLWPNPVSDGRVSLRIEGISDSDQRITVDVYDAFGKRVIATQYANSGDLFNATLDLGNGIAAGFYTVNVTINDRTYVKRLSVL